MSIRRQEKVDQDLILGLDRACFPYDYRPEIDGVEWWVVRLNGVPIAYAGLKLIKGDAAYLSRAGVLPVHRKTGLHRRLINVRLAHARRSGFSYAITDTCPTNTASLNSMVSAGFKFFRPVYEWAGPEAMYLYKTIGRKGNR